MIYDVTDLNVYNRSIGVLSSVYLLEKQIPASHTKLSAQIASAAESVPANIAEGFAKRRSVKEWKRFLEISMGSSDEVISHLRAIQILSQYNPRLDKTLIEKIASEYKIISKQLNKLRTNWTVFKEK
jgi:four helix bundle protein